MQLILKAIISKDGKDEFGKAVDWGLLNSSSLRDLMHAHIPSYTGLKSLV